MSIAHGLPGGEGARTILGLEYGEIARAVQTDESTLYLWRQRQVPGAEYVGRLEHLDHLAREIQGTMRSGAIQGWLNRPSPALDGETPRSMILRGRSEIILGMLISFNAGASL